MIVVDASALVETLLNMPDSGVVNAIMFDSGTTLHAPHLIDIEVTQAVRRFAAAGRIASVRAKEALADLVDLPVQRYPHGDLLPRIWALRQNLTAYDATYVALAEALDARLLTRDRRLAAAVDHRVQVVWV